MNHSSHTGSKPSKGDIRRLRRLSESLLNRLNLPDKCDIPTLCELLSQERGRPLHLVPLAMGAAHPCGMWLALDVADLVVFEADTSRLHRDHIIAHELAHMICGHRDVNQPEKAGLEQLFPDLDPRRVHEMLGRTSYSSQEEQEAEILASLILERVTRPPKEPVWKVPPAEAQTVARIDRTLQHPE
ncbi:toxin [Streptomyces silvisoli]|uniref:Toxin n=1 Tax=Streptomyces silvisoli TaxID=3034235 RepID=A0ABT5ZL33_9ACTN|nr:toxin [Streptomyces silvisoli]MDF3290512.1 toxin [Streptomyces silvisoli]